MPIMSGFISRGTPTSSAIDWNSPMSFCTKSIVKFTSRDPDRINWLSVSCTKDVPELILIASYVVAISSPAAFIVTIASHRVSRLAVAR